VRKKAKKSIANFALREGQEIGAGGDTARRSHVGVPRPLHQHGGAAYRDFRGLSTRSFDGRGNYSLGVKEQMIFPEINYDMIDAIHGMDVTFVTTTERDDQRLRAAARAWYAVPW
jgi:large subunit ribosomal protein L5